MTLAQSSHLSTPPTVEDIDLIEMRLRTLVERGFEIALNPLVVDWPLVNAIRQACPQVDQNGPMVKYLIPNSRFRRLCGQLPSFRLRKLK